MKWWSDLRLRWKLLGVFLLCALASGIGGSLAIRDLSKIDQDIGNAGGKIQQTLDDQARNSDLSRVVRSLANQIDTATNPEELAEIQTRGRSPRE